MYVGQPVAVVVADNRYIAEDAADLIKVEYEQIKPIVDPYEAMKEGSPLVQEQVERNIQMEFHLSIGDAKQVEQQSRSCS